MSDRLLRLLQGAATGAPPAADGVVEVWPAPAGAVDAVLAFTAPRVAAGVEPALVAARLPEGDLTAPMSPGFLGWLGEQLGSLPGSLDVALAAQGLGGEPPLELRPSPDRHPRARHGRCATAATSRSGPTRRRRGAGAGPGAGRPPRGGL